MSPPRAEAIDLTNAMVSAVKAGDWPNSGRPHERRAKLLKPGRHMHANAPRLLPRLDAAQQPLAAMLSGAIALDEASELLRPIRDGVRQAMGPLP